MEAFRLSHAGVVLRDTSSAVLIDPGNMSSATELAETFAVVGPPVALVITHEHADHWTIENVQHIRTQSPNCPILTTEATATALREADVPFVEVVREGDRREYGPFVLDFYGHKHEVLHSSIPVIDNIGVHVNGLLAYGGDSLARPPFPVDVLGVPIGSPWSSLSQVIDFVLTAAPKRAYLTHDGMLSDRGLVLYEARVRDALKEVGGTLLALPRPDPDSASGGAAL